MVVLPTAGVQTPHLLRGFLGLPKGLVHQSEGLAVTPLRKNVHETCRVFTPEKCTFQTLFVTLVNPPNGLLTRLEKGV